MISFYYVLTNGYNKNIIQLVQNRTNKKGNNNETTKQSTNNKKTIFKCI